MMRLFLFVSVVLLLTGSARADNWPAWRGPHGTGRAHESSAPLKWSSSTNVKWKAALPGPGNATPIVWGDRVFIAQARDDGRIRSLICFDRDDGEQLWTREVRYEDEEPTHKTNPYCSSSPVTDGERVIVWFGSAGLFAYDFDGKELWRKDLGQFRHVWGNASSPVLHGDSAILHAGPGPNTFLAAFDKKTGEERWRKDLPLPEGLRRDSGSWGTPVLTEIDGRTQLVLSVPNRLVGLDPATGDDLWSCGGLTRLVYTSPLVSSEFIVAMSGFGGSAVAVRTGGSGDVTETHRLWQHRRNPQRVGSGIIIGNHIYILNATGVAWCVEAKTGEKTWEARLASSWTSMVHAAGRLYIATTSGKTFVLEPDPTECRILAENRLPGTTRASLAFSDGQIFQRTYDALYCIEESSADQGN